MLPDFDDHGNLPPGIHRATIEEVAERFGQGSSIRRLEMRELADFAARARRAGARRLLVNGSFVTAKRSPNDVDVVLLPAETSVGETEVFPLGDAVWPFLQILIAADDEDFERWAKQEFAEDRRGRSKGVVEVIL
jgi:hypothetical protein